MHACSGQDSSLFFQIMQKLSSSLTTTQLWYLIEVPGQIHNTPTMALLREFTIRVNGLKLKGSNTNAKQRKMLLINFNYMLLLNYF